MAATKTKTRATSSPANKTKAGPARAGKKTAAEEAPVKSVKKAAAKPAKAAKAAKKSSKAAKKSGKTPLKAATKPATATKAASATATRATAKSHVAPPAKKAATPTSKATKKKAAAAYAAPVRRPSKAPAAGLPTAFASTKDVQILVVDDEPEVLNLLVPFLEKRGYSVSEAEDGDQALEKILTDRPHVVLLDVMMPGLNGWEIARYVRDREELDGVRIVMATGIGEEMNAATAPLHGADAYLDKPFRLDDVERIVLDVLRRFGS